MKDFQVREVRELSYAEFDALTKEVYGREYDFVPSEEANNDSDHLFVGVKDEPLDGCAAESLQKFLNGEEVNWFAWGLLQDLCFKKKIPPGDYLIRVYW